MIPTPLFVTGIARGGTSLVGRMLDAHPHMAVAIDACLPLFRALRNSIVMNSDPAFDASRPMEDSYFDVAQRERQAILLNGDIDVPLRGVDLENLRAALQRRAGDESADLVPALGNIFGSTMREIFDQALSAVAQVRSKSDLACVGFKDLWIADLIPALARGYDGARFIIVFRDPRDVITSVLGYLPIDPGQVGHVLSFLRHWRKSVALAYRFAADAQLRSRVMTVRYEDLVANPDRCARKMCEFLEVSFDPAMIEIGKFKEYGKAGLWQGNSTFENGMNTISRSPIGRWRNRLEPAVIGLIELTCGSEMQACGYEVAGAKVSDDEILRFLESDSARQCNWRSDSGKPAADLKRERARQALLALPRDHKPAAGEIADAFLFDEVYEVLRETQRPIVEAMV